MLYEYDASNEACPLPLVKLRVMLKKMLAGDSCLITIADKGSKQDIPKLLDKQGYRYRTREIDHQLVEILIQARN